LPFNQFMKFLLKIPVGVRLLITVLIILAAGAGIYWYVATDTFADTSNRRAAFKVSAQEFIVEFNTNDTAANKKYTDKIVTVSGRVAAVEPADTTVNIKFIDSTSGSYAIFAFQEQHLAEAKAVKPGDSISIKGSCSGGIFSSILGYHSISFKRCAINK
jgi:hypothetical protein